jgi:phage tail sheath protein FI
MATYQRPGVFIEESLQPLADPSIGSGDYVAAFVGTSLRGGPVGPTLVSSWTQFQSLFGDIRTSPDDLHYGVWQYFSNGGHLAYVVRGINTNAVAASLTINDTQGSPAPTMKITASSPGAWASDATSPTRLYVTVQPSTDATRFDLIIQAGTGGGLLAREQFVDLTLDPSDSRNAVAIVNSPTVGSQYIDLVALGTWVAATNNPAVTTTAPLTGGTEGTGTPDLVTAAKKLEALSSVITLNLPGVSAGTPLTDTLNWASSRTNIFVVVDGPKPATTDGAPEVTTTMTTFASSLPKTSYAAVYAPWLYLADPASSVPGAMRLVAPGGAVVGQYALTDTSRGVHKAPAGLDTAVKGVLGTYAQFTETQLDTLNQAGVNVIRSMVGAGFCIMGARTLNTRMPDRYINIRRALISLAKSLRDITAFAIFEPNNAALWEQIQVVVQQFLIAQMQSGLLKGSIPETAFYVKCDAENNPPASQNAGIVYVEVGVALNSPAEFIIIRIGQFDGGATTDITA